MKILSIQHYPVFGGPHNEIIKIENNLREKGFETIVVITNEKGNAFDILKKYTKVISIKLSRFRNTWNIFTNIKVFFSMPFEIITLLKIIKKENIDYIKVHGLHNPHGVLAALISRKRIIWVLSSNRLPGIMKFFGSFFVLILADVILTNGKFLQKDFFFLKFRRHRMFHYYPPVAKWVNYNLTPSEIYSDTKVSLDKKIIGMVGNISPQKGVDYFVKAASKLLKKDINIQFIIIGSIYDTHTNYYNTIMALINNDPLLKENIFFLGYKENVQDYLSTFYLSIITSRWEGTTTTAGESLSVGTPVIAFDVGAIHEIINHGKNGYLASPYNLEELVFYITDLLNNTQKYEQFKKNALSSSNRYLTDVCAEKHLEAYNSLSVMENEE